MKLCKLCGERPASVPDRDKVPGAGRLEVCSVCHAERLRDDLRAVLAWHERNRPEGMTCPKT